LTASSTTISHTELESNVLDIRTNDFRRAAGNTLSTPDICVIGAGSSGITVAKALHQRGVAFDCFEKGSDIGGMWRYENDSGLSSAYASLHIDTSRDNLGYSDFPIPKDMPDFLSHAQFLKYLESYADHFGIRKLVTFKTAVEAVQQASNGRWNVRLSTGEVRGYGKVIVANGHLWDPRTPAFAGEFSGETIHSHYYRTAAPFEGKSVLVVGLGNSAVDIAVDLCRRASDVTISTRRSAWIMPKYLFGRPTDQWSKLISRKLRLPTRWTRKIMARLVRLGVGDQSRFGLKKPAHPMWREHATLSQELLPYLGHGWIKVKPDIRQLDGREVEFEDGSRKRFDAIVHATGYRTSFPFLDKSLFDPETEAGDLYRRMVSLKHPDLIFAGLVQPVGPTIPLVEIQGRCTTSTNGRLISMQPAMCLRSISAPMRPSCAPTCAAAGPASERGHDMVTHRWSRRPEASNWGEFGEADQLGRLNLVTPEKVHQGLAEVKDGIAFSLSLPHACLPQITSGHIDDAVRPGSGGRRYSRPIQRRAISARPCSMTNECACRCNSPCTTAAGGADGVRQISRYDQCIPCGSSRSTVPRRRFARVSEKTSDDLECRSTEPGGQRSRHKLDRDPGSDNEELAPSRKPQ
jgi:dimethylaniline monooxygenase (N-oxide forming)